jgi:hypothetical protein
VRWGPVLLPSTSHSPAPGTPDREVDAGNGGGEGAKQVRSVYLAATAQVGRALYPGPQAGSKQQERG